MNMHEVSKASNNNNNNKITSENINEKHIWNTTRLSFCCAIGVGGIKT